MTTYSENPRGGRMLKLHRIDNEIIMVAVRHIVAIHPMIGGGTYIETVNDDADGEGGIKVLEEMDSIMKQILLVEG